MSLYYFSFFNGIQEQKQEFPFRKFRNFIQLLRNFLKENLKKADRISSNF